MQAGVQLAMELHNLGETGLRFPGVGELNQAGLEPPALAHADQSRFNLKSPVFAPDSQSQRINNCSLGRGVASPVFSGATPVARGGSLVNSVIGPPADCRGLFRSLVGRCAQQRPAPARK